MKIICFMYGRRVDLYMVEIYKQTHLNNMSLKMSQLSFFTSLPSGLRLSTWIWSHWSPGSRCQRTAGRCWCRTRGSPSWGWRRTRPRVLTSGSPPRSASAGDHLALIWNRERNFKRQGNSRNSKKNLFMDIKFKSFFLVWEIELESPISKIFGLFSCPDELYYCKKLLMSVKLLLLL